MEKLSIERYKEEIEQRLNVAKENYLDFRAYRKITQYFGISGLVCLAYLSLKAIAIGTDIFTVMNESKSFLNMGFSHIDEVAAAIGIIGLPAIIASLVYYSNERDWKMDKERYERDVSSIKTENSLF